MTRWRASGTGWGHRQGAGDRHAEHQQDEHRRGQGEPLRDAQCVRARPGALPRRRGGVLGSVTCMRQQHRRHVALRSPAVEGLHAHHEVVQERGAGRRGGARLGSRRRRLDESVEAQARVGAPSSPRAIRSGRRCRSSSDQRRRQLEPVRGPAGVVEHAERGPGRRRAVEGAPRRPRRHTGGGCRRLRPAAVMRSGVILRTGGGEERLGEPFVVSTSISVGSRGRRPSRPASASSTPPAGRRRAPPRRRHGRRRRRSSGARRLEGSSRS